MVPLGPAATHIYSDDEMEHVYEDDDDVFGHGGELDECDEENRPRACLNGGTEPQEGHDLDTTAGEEGGHARRLRRRTEKPPVTAGHDEGPPGSGNAEERAASSGGTFDLERSVRRRTAEPRRRLDAGEPSPSADEWRAQHTDSPRQLPQSAGDDIRREFVQDGNKGEEDDGACALSCGSNYAASGGDAAAALWTAGSRRATDAAMGSAEPSASEDAAVTGSANARERDERDLAAAAEQRSAAAAARIRALRERVLAREQAAAARDRAAHAADFDGARAHGEGTAAASGRKRIRLRSKTRPTTT